MKELFLLKLGEIVLKGQNRRVFEDKLKTVTRRRMAKFGEFKVNIVQSTLYVEPLTEDCDLDGAWEACGTIFGVAQMCRCRACEKNLDAMFNAVCEYLGDELSADEKSGVQAEIEKVKEALKGTDTDMIKASRSNPSARISASR